MPYFARLTSFFGCGLCPVVVEVGGGAVALAEDQKCPSSFLFVLPLQSTSPPLLFLETLSLHVGLAFLPLFASVPRASMRHQVRVYIAVRQLLSVASAPRFRCPSATGAACQLHEKGAAVAHLRNCSLAKTCSRVAPSKTTTKKK